MLYDLAQQLFIRAIDIHIRLLKLDYVKHKATEEVYDYAFNLMHELGEKYESMWMPVIDDNSTNWMINELYKEVEDMKESLKEAISEEEDEWVKNLLISKYDAIQLLCVKLESLTKSN